MYDMTVCPLRADYVDASIDQKKAAVDVQANASDGFRVSTVAASRLALGCDKLCAVGFGKFLTRHPCRNLRPCRKLRPPGLDQDVA